VPKIDAPFDQLLKLKRLSGLGFWFSVYLGAGYPE
jgi:hypothetical protein